MLYSVIELFILSHISSLKVIGRCFFTFKTKTCVVILEVKFYFIPEYYFLLKKTQKPLYYPDHKELLPTHSVWIFKTSNSLRSHATELLLRYMPVSEAVVWCILWCSCLRKKKPKACLLHRILAGSWQFWWNLFVCGF